MIKKILFIVSVFFCAFAYAESPSEALTRLLLNIHTLQADFSQVIQGKTMQQSQGHISLQRPGKFRWEVTSPMTQLIIANGARLWIYDPDLEQVTIKSFSKSTGQSPAFLLSDANLTLEKDFFVKEISHTPTSQTFLLKPKDNDNMFADIQLTFIQKQIRVMQLQDRLGHVTRITFKNVKLNAPLATALFSFKPLLHVDVIDETKR